MRLPGLLLQTLILSLLLTCDGRTQTPTCTVARITDGDTIRCTDGTRVRLLTIDVPEMDQGPFGRAAQAFLEHSCRPAPRPGWSWTSNRTTATSGSSPTSTAPTDAW